MIELSRKDIERFWSYVERGSDDSCWLWRGAPGSSYGIFTLCRNGKATTHGAHRIAFLLEHHDPGDFLVLHSCDVPLCVNPGHLFLGTQADNVADRVAKGRSATGDRHGSRTHPERLARGASNGMSKLDEVAVSEIRRLAMTGVRHKDIAGMFGVSRSNVGEIVSRRTWRHVA